MLMTFDEVSKKIQEGCLLHISGSENIIKNLPKGNWIAGSTEYFMTDKGGLVSDELFFVDELRNEEFKIVTYDNNTLPSVAKDAFDNGYTILIIPYNSELHMLYAEEAAGFEGLFMKNVVGWISGTNMDKPEQTPITINGETTEVFTDKAVAVHIRIPEDKFVNMGIINIFTPDENAPEIEFLEVGDTIDKCLVGGKEVVLADYLAENNIDTKLPIIGNYSGANINTGVVSIDDGKVKLYVPVYDGLKYRTAKPLENDYATEFSNRMHAFKGAQVKFACNCIQNFMFGELEGKDLDTFFGPITYGEIAYQLMGQTLVYLTIE